MPPVKQVRLDVGTMSKRKKYQELKTTPFETGIRNFTSVAKFFMYYAPGIDSAQSPGDFDALTSQNLINEMIEVAEMGNRARFLRKIQPASWKSVNLENDEVDFEQPCLLCDKYNQETELHALLRHMRNAFAHGHLYVWRKVKKGDYIFLVDFEARRGGEIQKISAKIMISLSILEKWRAIIENQIAIGE